MLSREVGDRTQPTAQALVKKSYVATALKRRKETAARLPFVPERRAPDLPTHLQSLIRSKGSPT